MDLEEALQKIADLEAKNADISRNFKAFRELSEKEKESLSSELEKSQKELSTELEKTKGEYDTFKKSIEDEKKARLTSIAEKKLEEMTKGDKKMQEALKAELALLNMPEDSEETITAKYEKARSVYTASQAKTTGVGEAAGFGGGFGGGSVSNDEISPNVSALLATAGIK